MNHTAAVSFALLALIVAVTVPFTALAATFQNPLASAGFSAENAIRTILQNIIIFLIGITAFVALAALTYGGLRLVLGAATSEQEVARAKQIIYWAIIGLVVVAMAATILATIRDIL